MKALILAAGRGTRLGGSDAPKCLTMVSGQPLLDRYLDVLEKLGIPVNIVVGHGASFIRKHVERRKTPPTMIDNPRYAEGSIVSLAAGLGVVHDDILLLDGDVAFTPALLENLVQNAAPNALLVDVGTEFTDEQYMAGINDTRVVALRRGAVPGHESQGEWVGFAKLSHSSVGALHDLITQQIARGETRGGYEDALATLLQSVTFTVVPTNGAPWVEIDFAADLERAHSLFANNAMNSITIVGYRPELAPAFASLNKVWIERFFSLEASDLKMLDHPDDAVIKPGGQILFAMDAGVPIGTVAAIPTGNDTYELAKMTVKDGYQGRGIGDMLGRALIEWARGANATMLHLETNRVLDNAIRLYERLGFVHAVAPVPSEYKRADVYMKLVLK